MEKNKKTVFIPIKVPIGKYCNIPDNACKYFAEMWEHPTCNMHFSLSDCDKKGRVLKSKDCTKLEGLTF